MADSTSGLVDPTDSMALQWTDSTVTGPLTQQAWGFLSSRHFSINSESGEGLTEPVSLEPTFAEHTAASQAAVDAASNLSDAATTLANSAASLDISGPVSLAMHAVDTLHAATGAPWWATISAVGILVRLAMLPVTLKGMEASAALMPLLNQARQQAANEMPGSFASSGVQHAPAGASGAAEAAAEVSQRTGQQQSQQQQQQQQSHEHEDGQEQQQQRAPQPSLGQVMARFHELRQRHNAPHPAWIIGSPLIQFPIFVTAMLSIRRMSIAGWEGFSTGGLAWFTDLTLPAMDLANFNAPMGNLGIVLPLTVAVSMYATIDVAFSAPPGQQGGGRQGAPVMLYVMDKLRLLLEWMVVPMFIIALQLPQGAVWYWVTTSTFTLPQNYAFRLPSVRHWVGLPTGRPGPLPAPTQKQPLASLPLGAEGEDEAGIAGAAGAAQQQQGWTAEDEAALQHFLSTTRDQLKLFERAAQLRVEGKVGAAITALRRLLQLYPKQPRALFALGQLHAVLKDWHASELCYQESASSEPDKHQRGRAWFGVGVALHMQQEHETAIQAFQKAAKFAQEDELRLRAWVSEATLQKKAGSVERALQLLRRAAKLEPKVEELYLKPLLKELEGGGKLPPSQGD
ncbi:hypothetical protein N2152v2_010932 [Parachlorella kessleri]